MNDYLTMVWMGPESDPYPRILTDTFYYVMRVAKKLRSQGHRVTLIRNGRIMAIYNGDAK